MGQKIEPIKTRGVGLVSLFILFAVLLSVVGSRYYFAERAQKETTLLYELMSIRMSVQTYLISMKKYPEDLRALIPDKPTVEIVKLPYLYGIKIDSEGYPVDTFGRRFNYEPDTGWVSLASPKYSSW